MPAETSPKPPAPAAPHSGEAERPDRARRALELFLQQTTEFRLALALYNDSLARDATIRALTEQMAASGLRILTLDLRTQDDSRPLVEQVRTLVASAPGKPVAVMVVNLETRVDYTPELSTAPGPGADFLANANLHREAFPATCPAPLLLWMTELLERAFVRFAPDLWHWRSHVFDLRTRRIIFSGAEDSTGQVLRSDDYHVHPIDRLRKLEEELAGYRRVRSRWDEMRVLNAMGLAHWEAGNARAALKDFTESLEIAREIGDRRAEGTALGNLGLAHAELGDIRRAIEVDHQRLDIARETGDRGSEANALNNLGLIHSSRGDAQKAITCYLESLAIKRQICDRRGESNALGNLGLAYAELGDTGQAIQLYQQQLAISREIADRRGESAALGNLGLLHTALGNPHAAMRFYEQQLLIAREIGDRRGEGGALSNLGLAHAEVGDTQEALSLYDQALLIGHETGDPTGEATADFNTAILLWRLGERDRAIESMEKAWQTFAKIENRSAERAGQLLEQWRAEAEQPRSSVHAENLAP